MFFHEHEKHYQVFLYLKDGSISQSDKGNSDSWAYGIIGY